MGGQEQSWLSHPEWAGFGPRGENCPFSGQHTNKNQAPFLRTGTAPWNPWIHASEQDEALFTLPSPPKPHSNKRQNLQT